MLVAHSCSLSQLYSLSSVLEFCINSLKTLFSDRKSFFVVVFFSVSLFLSEKQFCSPHHLELSRFGSAHLMAHLTLPLPSSNYKEERQSFKIANTETTHPVIVCEDS